MKSKINPKLCWSHTRKNLKTKSSLVPLQSNPEDRESMKFTDEGKANILQKQFASVFTHLDALENVQIRETKLVDGFGNLEYSERLRKLNLPVRENAET